jgi:hypothetical protein
MYHIKLMYINVCRLPCIKDDNDYKSWSLVEQIETM